MVVLAAAYGLYDGFYQVVLLLILDDLDSFLGLGIQVLIPAMLGTNSGFLGRLRSRALRAFLFPKRTSMERFLALVY